MALGFISPSKTSSAVAAARYFQFNKFDPRVPNLYASCILDMVLSTRYQSLAKALGLVPLNRLDATFSVVTHSDLRETSLLFRFTVPLCIVD
jgi:hypothetical protein